MTDLIRLRADALEWREIDGEVVALDLRRQTYLAVNEGGTVVWPALAAGTTLEELVSRMVDAFEVDPARAAVDINAFVAELTQLGLIEGE